MTEQSKAPLRAVQQAQVVVQLTPAQAAARELADELAYNKENGIDFGGELPEGGKFLGTDGKLHNAHGQLIDEDGTVLDADEDDRGEVAAAEKARAASANDETPTRSRAAKKSKK